MFRKTFYQTDMLHVCISDEIALQNNQGHFICLSPLAIEPKNRLKSSPDVAACRSPFATAPLYSFG